MTTLQGIITKSVDNAMSQMDSIALVSTNLSNTNTNGYKAERFEEYLQDSGRITGVKRADYSQGGIANTYRPLDVAIDGAGFIPVTNADGTSAYTRDGSFTVNANGYVVTGDGAIVGDGIKIPANYDKIKITEDGTVKLFVSKEDEPTTIGKIPLVVFQNPEELKAIDGNKVLATAKSGAPVVLKDTKSIKQGKLERSNVNVLSQVDGVLRLNASMISSLRLIKVVDEFYRQSINLRQ